MFEYASFLVDAKGASEVTGHPEHVCFAALMLLRERGILRNDEEALGTLSNSGATAFKMHPEFTSHPSEFPADDELYASVDLLSEGKQESQDGEVLSPEVLEVAVRKLISANPSKFCDEGIDLSGTVGEELRIGSYQSVDAVVALERKGIIIPRSQGSYSYWWAKDAPESVITSKPYPKSQLLLIADLP